MTAISISYVLISLRGRRHSNPHAWFFLSSTGLAFSFPILIIYWLVLMLHRSDSWELEQNGFPILREKVNFKSYSRQLYKFLSGECHFLLIAYFTSTSGHSVWLMLVCCLWDNNVSSLYHMAFWFIIWRKNSAPFQTHFQSSASKHILELQKQLVIITLNDSDLFYYLCMYKKSFNNAILIFFQSVPTLQEIWYDNPMILPFGYTVCLNIHSEVIAIF